MKSNRIGKLKDSVSGILEKDITKKVFWWIIAAMIALKLVAVACQRIWIFPGSAPLDDELMFYAAKSVGEGEWFGAYGWLAMAKHMLFALWLSLLNALHIPFLIGAQLLYLAVCVAAVSALKPFAEKRIYRLLLFLVLWWSPYSTAQYTLRVYSDNIYHTLCLLFFAGAIGLFVRFNEPFKKALPYAVMAGLGLGLASLCKDDAMWLLPFAVCGSVVYLVFAMLSKKKLAEKLLCVALGAISIAIVLACTNAYKLMNYKYYGRYIISDYTSSEFKEAVADIVDADTDVPHDGILVCRATREKLYDAVPSLALLQDRLESWDYLNVLGSVETNEYTTSGIIWGIRRAAWESGYTSESAQQAKDFYEQLSSELEEAFSSGRLERMNRNLLTKVSPTLVPFDKSYIVPTLGELLRSLRTLLFFEQTTAFGPLSYATPEQALQWSEYTFTLAGNVAKEYTAIPDRYIYEIVMEIGFSIVRWLYRILVWFALFFAVKLTFGGMKSIAPSLKSKNANGKSILPILMLGVLLSVLLRVGMISYIEAVSFQIGTQLMYLAPAGSALMLFVALGAVQALKALETKQNSGE